MLDCLSFSWPDNVVQSQQELTIFSSVDYLVAQRAEDTDLG